MKIDTVETTPSSGFDPVETTVYNNRSNITREILSADAQLCVSSSAVERVKQVVSASVQKARAKVLAKQADKTTALTVSGLFKFHWKPAVRESGCRHVLEFTPKERGMARNLIKELGVELPGFIAWCVSNWHMVRKNKF